MFLPISEDLPVPFVSGFVFGLLQHEQRTSREWTLTVREDDGTERLVRGVPRHLTTDVTGSLFFPVEDGKTNRIPFLRLSGFSETFVPVDRISSISFEDRDR